MVTTQKKGKTVLILAGLAAIYFVAKKAIDYSSQLITFRPPLEIGGTFANPKLTVTFAINNPSNSEIHFQGLQGVIKYGSEVIANVVNVDQVILNPLSGMDIKMEIYSTSATLFDLAKVMSTTGLKKNFSFDGTIGVDNVRLPIKKSLS